MGESEGRMFLSALPGMQSIHKYSDLAMKDIPDETCKFSVLIVHLVWNLVIHATAQCF